MVKLVGSELAKCTAGATDMLENSDQELACSSTAAQKITAFIAYGNANSDNPYGGASPYVTAASTNNGESSIVLSGTTDIVINTTWEGGTATEATLTIE